MGSMLQERFRGGDTIDVGSGLDVIGNLREESGAALRRGAVVDRDVSDIAA